MTFLWCFIPRRVSVAAVVKYGGRNGPERCSPGTIEGATHVLHTNVRPLKALVCATEEPQIVVIQ